MEGKRATARGTFTIRMRAFLPTSVITYVILQLSGVFSLHSHRPLSLVMPLSDEPSEPLKVIAGEGGKAILPCTVARPPNDSIDLILWFRGDAETALYSLDARSGPIQRARHFPSDDLSSRAYIDITGRPTSLVIDTVKGNDGGEYRCRIDFRRGRTQYRTIQLEVIVPPKDVIIMDEYGQRLRDFVGPFNEGAHLTLICETEGGRPIPSLIWLKNRTTIDDSWTVTPQGVIRNELVISRLTRSDLMTTLICQAYNSNLTKPVTSSITLDLNLRPLDVQITSLKRPLSAGKKVQLNCQSRGSRPAPVITWWKGTKRLQHVTEDVATVENLTTSSVHFTPSIEDNGKILACRADHSILPDSALEDTWTLDVYYVPKLSLSLGANVQDDEVREGSDLTFQCHVQSNPTVKDIAWQYNGRPLITNNALGILVQDSTVLISQARREHSGRYRCLAANVEGEGQSKEINLRVLYAPICAQDQKTIYGVGTREPLQVPCQVEADPPKVTFKWTLNNTYQLSDIKNVISSGLRSVATYAPRTHLGYGQLLCTATNKIGETSEPCVFNVVPAGPPQAIRNCLVGNQSTDSMVIKCEAGEDGGLEQIFYLEIFHLGSGLLQSNYSSSKSPVFEITGLTMSTSYALVLYAANAKGRSHSVTLNASTLPFPSKEISIVTPVIAVLVGIVGSLVLTTIIILMIAKFRGFDSEKNAQGAQRNSSVRSNPAGDNSVVNTNGCSNHNGNATYGSDSNGDYEMNVSWTNRDIKQSDKYVLRDEPSIGDPYGVVSSEGHVTLTLEPRRTPEGELFTDRCQSESGSTISSSATAATAAAAAALQQQHQHHHHHHHQTACCEPTFATDNAFKRYSKSALVGQREIIKEPSVVVLNEDHSILTAETPLISGLYFPQYSTARSGHQKHVTPLSTPV